MRWAPIADRRTAGRVRGELRAIAAALAEPVAVASPALALGDAGTAVLFAYLARAGLMKHAGERARIYAARAAAAVGRAPLPLGLFGGLAGIAWTLHHLRVRRALCAQIDAALAMAVIEGALDEVDLVSGLCGVGVHALARGDRRLAGAVVARLRATGAPHDDGTVWLHDGDRIDLGTAHGLAGLVAMLGQARAARIPGAAQLARRATAGLVAHARWELPSVLPDKATRGALPAGACRLAWCYGDLGAACALATAAGATRDAALAATAAALARSAAARSVEGAGVVDVGVCHGAAGIALGLQRMFLATGDPALRSAAHGWLIRALAYGVPAGLDSGPDAAHGRGLLGAAGLGLAYLAAIAPIAPRWSSVLAIVAA